MLYLEKTAMHTVTAANYVTSVNGMVHPDRILEEHDFLYILDGTFEIWEEDSVYSLKSDELLILAAGRHHFGKIPCSPGNRHMYIHALPTAAEHSAEQVMKSASSYIEDKSLLCVDSHIDCRKCPRIRNYFHEIIAACWSDSAERDTRLSLMLSLLLCEISELTSRTDEVKPVPDALVEEVSRRIRTTPHIFFTAKEIAGDYYISERTLNNHFQKYYGKTFFAFQMETRLEMARQFLLTQPQAKLREAAVNYGFYDEFHLSKAFKKQYGQPPSVWRKML